MSVTKTATLGADGIWTLAFDQSAAEESELVAAPGAAQYIVVIGWLFTLDAAGTAWFEDDSDVQHSGKFDLAAASPFGWKGSSRNPAFTLAKGEALQLETTVGAASGILKYRILSTPA